VDLCACHVEARAACCHQPTRHLLFNKRDSSPKLCTHFRPRDGAPSSSLGARAKAKGRPLGGAEWPESWGPIQWAGRPVRPVRAISRRNLASVRDEYIEPELEGGAKRAAPSEQWQASSTKRAAHKEFGLAEVRPARAQPEGEAARVRPLC